MTTLEKILIVVVIVLSLALCGMGYYVHTVNSTISTTKQVIIDSGKGIKNIIKKFREDD